MPKWINGKERIPVNPGKYFVKTNGSRDIYSLYEFDPEKIDRYETFLWLDETVTDIVKEAVQEEPKNKIISSIINNISTASYKRNLINLFGVSKYEKTIKKVLKNG